MVTDRVQSLDVDGRRLHQVGVPYHWGFKGLTTGDSGNDLFPIALDPNVHIQEVKGASCDIRPGRRPRGPELRRLVESYPSVAEEPR
jgi:formate dehydrogenase major subunit